MDNLKKRKILLARTDRLGDLVLTTPAIKAVREAYPDAYIAMIVRPYGELLVKDNPYLDEVIVYDKSGLHRSVAATVCFALRLRKARFDRAVIFHPTNRMHIIAYIANIPRRIGYDSKLSFLLTDSIKNLKHEGKKHERDYTLDLLRALGIESYEKELYVAVDSRARSSIEQILNSHGIATKDRLVTLHPGASCVSKIWPSERFAKLADMLIEKHSIKIAVIGGKEKRDIFCVESVKKFMRKEAIFFKGALDMRELAALLKRSMLFISNDSGPVHVATAVGTPVVDIFGRNQPGLSPLRWGPLGENDIVMHKDVGCEGTCLAHNCNKSFACLSAVSVDDIYTAIQSMNLL